MVAFEKQPKATEFSSCLPLSLASHDKLLLNYLDIRLAVYTNTSRFLIEDLDAAVALGMEFYIDDAYVLLNEYDLADGYMNLLRNIYYEISYNIP